MPPVATPPLDHTAEIAAAIDGAESVCVITGAGVSAESGLRTFRGVTGMTPEDHASMAALGKGQASRKAPDTWQHY